MPDIHKYAPNSAGSKMVASVPRVQIGATIGDIEKELLHKAKIYATLDYIYVTDRNDVLRGVISIRQVFDLPKDVKVEEVMRKDPIHVHPHTHQERIVYLAISHGIKAVPVVDKDERLLGAVPYDVILQIFNNEVHEDVFKFGGIFHKVGSEYTTIRSSAWMMIKSRVPWLIVGVFGGIVAASIVRGFESVLSKYLVIASFIPVLVYLSDAVGTQSETLVVRSIALDPKFPLGPYLIREVKVASVLGITCGALLSAVSFIGWRDPMLGLIVGSSMFLSIQVAVLTSTFLPLFFNKINLDPAVAAGPFATMISDILTLAVYFNVAVLFLSLIK